MGGKGKKGGDLLEPTVFKNVITGHRVPRETKAGQKGGKTHPRPTKKKKNPKHKGSQTQTQTLYALVLHPHTRRQRKDSGKKVLLLTSNLRTGGAKGEPPNKKKGGKSCQPSLVESVDKCKIPSKSKNLGERESLNFRPAGEGLSHKIMEERETLPNEAQSKKRSEGEEIIAIKCQNQNRKKKMGTVYRKGKIWGDVGVGSGKGKKEKRKRGAVRREHRRNR